MKEGKPYFKILKEKEFETDRATGTYIKLIYPSDSEWLIPKGTAVRSMGGELKLQRILSEHNVYSRTRRGDKRIKPYLETVTSKVVSEHTLSVGIPDNLEDLRTLLNSDEIEVGVRLLEIESLNELKKYRSSSQKSPTSDMRGIVIEDHTTIYGMLDIDNELGSEFLQMHVTIPSLRVFAVQSVLADSKFTSLVGSNRKTLNLQHPVIKLVEDKIRAIWNEEVERRANLIRERERKRENKKLTAMNSKLENKLNRIFNDFMKDLGEAPPPGLGDPVGESGNSVASPLTSGPLAEPRPKSLFGPQNTAYGSNIIIKPGRERRIKIFVHKDLVRTRMETLVLKADSSVIYDPELSSTMRMVDLRIGPHVKKRDSHYEFEAIFRPSWEEDPGKNYIVNLMLDVSSGVPLALDLSGDYHSTLVQAYPNYKVPRDLTISETGNGWRLHVPIKIVIGSEAEADDTGGLINIEWLTDKEVSVGPDRKERQNRLKTGWTATPSSKLVDGEYRTSYVIRVFLRSRFFAGSFDEKLEVTDQGEMCTSLMAMAVCCGLADILVAQKMQHSQDEDQLSTYREYINSHYSDILDIIASETWNSE